jgi:hypothetical protein
MPWAVRRASKPWAVLNLHSGEVEACHESEEAAQRQQAALYASTGEGKGASSGSSNTSWMRQTIEAVLAGECNGDPFDGFGRESLVKVALARGLDVPIGASREQVALLLLDCMPVAERKFDPDEPRDPHSGRWIDTTPGDGGTNIVKDVLKLAGRIDLDPDERFVGSAKVDGDRGSIRAAFTQRGESRLVRLGIGGDGFGSRDDDTGPWRGGPVDVGAINTERRTLRVEQRRLEAELDAPGTGAARRAVVEKRLAELDDMDLDDVEPSGYTARLDAANVERLRTTLADALAEGAAKQKAVDAAYEAGRDEPPRPAAGFWTFAEGSVPGEWADVHFSVYLDDPDVGVEVHLAAVPHGSGATLDDLQGLEQSASLDPAKARKLLRLLGTVGGS